MADIIIENGIVITMDPQRRVLEDGAVVIAGGRIVAVGPTAEVARQHNATKRIDAKYKAVLPGLIDCHTHAGHGMTKTIGGGNSRAWFSAVGHIYRRACSPDFWRAEGALAALERLRFGTTTAVALLGGGDSTMRCDDIAFMDAHCEAVAEIGVKEIVVAGHPRPPFPWTYSSWDGAKEHVSEVGFEKFMETCEASVDKWHGAAGGRIRVALLSPVQHELADAAQAEEVYRQSRVMREMSRRKKVLFHQDGHRRGSIAAADRHADLLGPDAFLSHCIELTEEDIAALVRTGTRVVNNPSAVNSIRGRCPAPELIDRGVIVVLGTDATAPDRSADMFRNMWQAMHYHRRHFRDEQVLPPGKVLEMCTIDAAKCLHLDHEIGSLEAGKKADVILVDLYKPHMAPVQMPVYRVVCFASGQDVDTVIVDGRIVLEQGVVRTVDTRKVLDAAQREAELMLDRSGFHEYMKLPANFWGKTHY